MSKVRSGLARRGSSVAFCFALGLIVVSRSAPAQMRRSVLESLPILSSSHGWNVTKNFATMNSPDFFFIGSISNYAVNIANQNADDPLNVAYMNFIAPAGASVFIWPSFGDPIPAPTATTDACHHAHLGFAVYKFGIRLISFGTGAFTIPVITLQSSTGELGKRYDANNNQVADLTPNATCTVNPYTDAIYPSLNTFNWGFPFPTVTFGQQGDVNYMNALVAAQAASHGWGSCGHFLCFPTVQVMAFRTQ